jgi:adenylyltransferase/sulfurtransferase
VADLCEAAKITLVTAAVGRFDGSLTTIKPHGADTNGTQNPRYRDVFPEQPPTGLLPSCAEAGILGALTGVLGSLQALEVIKEITGIGELLVGRLLMVDAKAMRFETVKYKRNM